MKDNKKRLSSQKRTISTFIFDTSLISISLFIEQTNVFESEII